MSFASRKLRGEEPNFLVAPVVAGTDNHPVHDRLCDPRSFTGLHLKRLQQPSAARPASNAARWRTERPGPPLDSSAMLKSLSGPELNIPGRSADFRAQTDWRRGLRSAGVPAPSPIRRPASTRSRLQQLVPYLMGGSMQQQQQQQQQQQLAMPVDNVDKALLFQAIHKPEAVAPEQLTHLLVPAAPERSAQRRQPARAQDSAGTAEPGGLTVGEQRREQRRIKQKQRQAQKALQRTELEHQLAAVQLQRDLHERQRQVQQDQLVEVERLRGQHEEQLGLLQQRQRDARELLGHEMALRASQLEQVEAQTAAAAVAQVEVAPPAQDAAKRLRGREIARVQRETVRRFQLAAVAEANSPAAKAKAGAAGVGRAFDYFNLTREQSELVSSRRRRNQEELRKRGGGAGAPASRSRRTPGATAGEPEPQQLAPSPFIEEAMPTTIDLDMKRLQRPSHPKVVTPWYDDEQ
jgi:hypothetical protein